MGRLVVISGAGISAESGLKTFRDAGGLWEGHRIDVVCNYLTWKRNFEAVHAFYDQRRHDVEQARPNEAHRALARWETMFDAIHLSQNVDDLLERAGAQRVVHLHGFVRELHCEACGHDWDIGYASHPPGARCPECGSVKGVKPNVVFFNERAPRYAYLHKTLKAMKPQDVFLSIGTSGAVIDVAHFAVKLPCHRIFSALEPSEAVPEGAFDRTVYGPATQTVGLLETIIAERLGRTVA